MSIATRLRDLNITLPDAPALAAYLADREWLAEQATDRDCLVLRRFQRELRPVFEAACAETIIGQSLMAAFPVQFRMTGIG